MPHKRKRSSNFTAQEVETLVSLVIENQDKIECKKTDCVTNFEKDQCWDHIVELFNNNMDSGRCKEGLKNKWDSLKKTTRKYYSDQKKALKRTGSVPAVPNYLGAIGDKILGVIGVNSTGILSDNDCDDDKILDAEFIKIKDEYLNILETIQNEQISGEAIEIASENKKEKKDLELEEWNSASLRQKKHLAYHALEEKPVEETIKVATKNIHTYKSIPFYRKKLKRRQSQLAIYTQLVKKKIKFIDFQTMLLKEEHEAKMRRDKEKHELEMKILEQDLLNKIES